MYKVYCAYKLINIYLWGWLTISSRQDQEHTLKMEQPLPTGLTIAATFPLHPLNQFFYILKILNFPRKIMILFPVFLTFQLIFLRTQNLEKHTFSSAYTRKELPLEEPTKRMVEEQITGAPKWSWGEKLPCNFEWLDNDLRGKEHQSYLSSFILGSLCYSSPALPLTSSETLKDFYPGYIATSLISLFKNVVLV